jgi:TonB family protein
MKQICLLILVLFLTFDAKAQKDTLACYMRNSGEITKSKDSADYVLIFLPPDTTIDKNLFVVKQLSMNGKPKLFATSKIRSVDYKNGLQGAYVEFFPNGHKKCVRSYDNGKPAGDEIEYYPNGKLYTVRNYRDSVVTMSVCRDSLGNMLTENGNGRWIKYNDDYQGITEEGAVADGLKTGPWTETLSGEGEKYVAIYNKGVKLTAGKTLETQVKLNPGSVNVELAPEYPGGIDRFFEFINKTLRYPYIDKRNNVQGRVMITFVIEKNGSLTDIKAVRGPDESLKEEAVRATKLSPKWHAGTINGIPVRVKYTVPITFSLANY